MLEKVLKNINNYFYEFYEKGTFTIKDSVINVQGRYKEGQYIRIMDSTLNDGIYRVEGTLNGVEVVGLADEEFKGVIYSLAIPNDLLEIVSKIEEFNSKRAIDGLVSESIPGGYSYTKATVGGVPISWQGAFSMELRPYKKMFSGERYVRRWEK